MGLDALYGQAQEAAGYGVRTWETDNHPQSVVHANTSSEEKPLSNNILGTMIRAQDGCKLSQYLFKATILLWIITQDGNLVISLEEAAHPDKRHITIPILLSNRDASQGWNKLGHPSLLQPPHLGRIAGELVLRDKQGHWELNNSSGRYGLNCGRKESQLEAAAKLFEFLGLRIDTDFQGS